MTTRFRSILRATADRALRPAQATRNAGRAADALGAQTSARKVVERDVAAIDESHRPA